MKEVLEVCYLCRKLLGKGIPREYALIGHNVIEWQHGKKYEVNSEPVYREHYVYICGECWDTKQASMEYYRRKGRIESLKKKDE